VVTGCGVLKEGVVGSGFSYASSGVCAGDIATGKVSACCDVQSGKTKKKGVHSSKESNIPHVNDLSVPGSGSRAKAHLPFLQRGKQSGIVEHVTSGHRLKVRSSIPR
jgi:hypothetical protein